MSSNALSELAVVRHDVGEVVAAARLQIDVVDRVGELGGLGDVVAGGCEVSGRRFDPCGEQQGGRPLVGGAALPAAVECGQDSLRASAVAEHDPRPSEPVDDAERERAGRGPCSTPARRRCWRARSGRTRGVRLGGCCAHLRGGSGRVGEPRGVRGERGVGHVGVGHRFERERADAVEQPVAHAESMPRRRRSPANGWRGDRRRRSPPAAGTSSASRTDSTAASGAPPAKVASAHRPRWSSGNNSS